jgi:hypothetical protein
LRFSLRGHQFFADAFPGIRSAHIQLRLDDVLDDFRFAPHIHPFQDVRLVRADGFVGNTQFFSYFPR